MKNYLKLIATSLFKKCDITNVSTLLKLEEFTKTCIECTKTSVSNKSQINGSCYPAASKARVVTTFTSC